MITVYCKDLARINDSFNSSGGENPGPVHGQSLVVVDMQFVCILYAVCFNLIYLFMELSPMP